MGKLNLSPYLSINNILLVSIGYLKNISLLYYVPYKTIDINLCSYELLYYARSQRYVLQENKQKILQLT